MKLPLVAVRLGILAIKLIALMIIILSILPLMNGGIDVNFDTANDSDWSYTSTSLSLDSPLTVTNNGFYDINDLTIGFTFLGEDGEVLAESTSDSMDIPAGKETELRVRMTLDLDDLTQNVLSDIVFNGTRMEFVVEVSAKYSMDLVRISVEGGTDLSWQPMLSNLDIMNEYSRLMSDGSNHSLSIPYTFYAQDLIQGQPVMVLTQFSDSHGYMTNLTQVIDARDNVYEEAVVPITQEVYDRMTSGPEELTVSVTLVFLGCSNTVTETWGWSS
ncbi:MAG TPA: hypothetical protein VMW85_00915 [Methanomassiliicoccales archaeon]|nr:hypothetical protein [Methanomassiliicoccales archaeon]